jgi:outer membrane receptor protein involved in Fe transport
MLRQKAAALSALFLGLFLVCPDAALPREDTDAESGPSGEEGRVAAETTNLEPTVVVAPRSHRRPQNPTFSTSVLTSEDIEALAARNVGEALQFLPGVTVTRGARRNRIRVSIRGFDPRYVRVYMDGIPVNPATDEPVDLSTLPVENIERIEVIKGPAPVKYGVNAMAGVILITTKSGDQNPGLEPFYMHSFYPPPDTYTERLGNTQVTKEEDHGVYNGDHYGATLGAGTPSLNGFGMFSRDTSEGFRRHSSYENNNLNAKFGWAPNRNVQLGLTGGYFQGERDLLNPTVQLERSGQYGGGGGSGTGPMYGAWDWELKDWKRGNVGVTSELASAPWAATHAMGYAFQESYRLEVEKPGDPPGTRSESPRESLVAGGEIQQDFRVDQSLPFRLHHEFTLGFSGQYESFTWANSANPAREQAPEEQDASVVTLGVYVQDAVEVWKGLTVVAGLRHDLQTGANVSIDALQEGTESDRQQTSPNFSFLYDWEGRLQIHGAAGRTYRFPRLRDLYDYVAGNPDLKPESAWDFELGVDVWILPTAVFKVSAFHNEVEDLIYSAGKFMQFQNIGSARFRGVETEFMAEPVPGFNFFVNYTYMDARDLENDVWAPYAPTHKFAYGSVLSRWNFRLSYQGVCVSERATGDALTPSLPAYHVADMKLARRLPLPWVSPGSGAEVYVAVQNLFDEEYQEILGFPLPGRTFLLGGSLQWAW